MSATLTPRQSAASRTTDYQSPSLTSLLTSPRSDVETEHVRLLNETKAFLKDRDTLIDVIDRSDRLIDGLHDFAQLHWSLVHPQLNPPQPSVSSIQPVHSTAHPSDSSPSKPYSNPTSSNSSGLSILCLDHLSALAGRRTSAGRAEIESSLLSHQSVASSMLCSKMQSVQTHLADLRTRVLDRNSRILITGDLNAGKSTFVNALLARQVAPTDQQPCTEVMCEIVDRSQIDSTIEQIHAIPHGSAYDPNDPSTFESFPIDQLTDLVNVGHQDDADDDEDQKTSPYQLLKVYISGPENSKSEVGSDSNVTDAISILRQGDVSVSFIDSPGLNRDTLSTMELFSKQSTIDVVVFVVSAENQFTLSAQEFLWAASQEKAYVFVVVNKWGGIRDKVKAERRIREQLRKLSPATWQERSELVHFVDSQEAMINQVESQAVDAKQEVFSKEIQPFDHLQRSLSSFVFLRRSISKLQPAQTYTRNLLQDLKSITATNLEAAKKLYDDAQIQLEKILPRFNQLSANSHLVDESISQIEEDTVTAVYKNSRRLLANALKNIREGKLAPSVSKEPNSPEAYFPAYDGLLSIFQYAEDVRKVLLSSLEASVKHAENLARHSTSSAVEAIRENSVTKNLLEDDQSIERKFNPQAMFARGRKYPLINPANRSFGHCASSLGIATLGDLIDFDRLNWFKSTTSSKSIESYLNGAGSSSSTAGLVGSLGFGTLTLFGTGVTGGRAFVEALVKLSEIAGSKGFRKWTGTAVAIMSVGFGIYLILDIPRAIPRNIGKKLERELNEMICQGSLSHNGNQKNELATEWQEVKWIDYEIDRLTKETRKVVRLTGFELREKFRASFESVTNQTNQFKVDLEHSQDVYDWLNQFDVDLSNALDLCVSVGVARPHLIVSDSPNVAVQT